MPEEEYEDLDAYLLPGDMDKLACCERAILREAGGGNTVECHRCGGLFDVNETVGPDSLCRSLCDDCAWEVWRLRRSVQPAA